MFQNWWQQALIVGQVNRFWFAHSLRQEQGVPSELAESPPNPSPGSLPFFYINLYQDQSNLIILSEYSLLSFQFSLKMYACLIC